MDYRGTRFDREQLTFVVETILIGALDRIESGMPTSDVSYKERCERLLPGQPTDLSDYENGALASAGMSLAVLYAQLTDDDLCIMDALIYADNFDEACKNLVQTAWMDQGVEVINKMETKPQCKIEDLLPNYPDTRKHAEAFVNKVFDDYLGMPTFDVTLKGFDEEDESTEDKVWWVKAPNLKALQLFLGKNPRDLKYPPYHLEGRDIQISKEEVDIVLDIDGEVVQSNRTWGE